MTDATTLQELLRRVEGATGADREIDLEIGLALAGWKHLPIDASGNEWLKADDGYWAWPPRPGQDWPSFTESMDATLGLVERALPDWRWCARTDETRGAYCNVGASSEYGSPCFPKYAATPPLAVLASLLAALIAQANAPQESA